LKFVHLQMVNGVKCAKIEPQHVQSEIEYWNSAVLCSVIGANPPLEVIEGFVRRIWQAFGIDKICLVRKCVFLIRFQNINDHFTVVQRGVYFFDNKPFLVKPWNEKMGINIETLVTLLVWVRLSDLDINIGDLKVTQIRQYAGGSHKDRQIHKK